MAERDEWSVISATIPDDAQALIDAGIEAWDRDRLTEARVTLELAAALSSGKGSRHGALRALHLLACVTFCGADYEESRRIHTEVVTESRDIGFAGGVGASLCGLAMIDLIGGDAAAARERFEEALRFYEHGGYEACADKVRSRISSLAA